MADGRWRITVTTPDWGQDHLSAEAVVAFVDGELAHGPHDRATRHLAQCAECAAQVMAQGQARSALRMASCPRLPSALLSSLRSIPQDTELPGAPAGLAMTADGQLVSMACPEHVAPAPDGTFPDSSTMDARQADAGDPGSRSASQRRIRLGTGVAASGLALGALAFGFPAGPTGPATPTPPADRGVLNGSAFGGPSMIDAQFRVSATDRPAGPGPQRLIR